VINNTTYMTENLTPKQQTQTHNKYKKLYNSRASLLTSIGDIEYYWNTDENYILCCNTSNNKMKKYSKKINNKNIYDVDNINKLLGSGKIYLLLETDELDFYLEQNNIYIISYNKVTNEVIKYYHVDM